MNQNGNISLVGITFTLIISSLMVIIIHNSQRANRLIKIRSQIYLCSNFLTTKTQRFIKKIGNENKILLALYPLTLNPTTAAKAQIIQKIVQAKQIIDIVSYMKSLSVNKYCNWTQSLSFYKNIPYTNRRFPDGTLRARKKKWKTYLIANTHLAQKISEQILLISKFGISNRFSTTLSLATKELSKEDLPSLKQLYGYL